MFLKPEEDGLIQNAKNLFTKDKGKHERFFVIQAKQIIYFAFHLFLCV